MQASESATLCAGERREDRGDREDAGGYRDRHGQDVVRQERGCGDESGQRAEVLLREDVGAAARLVDRDALPVGENDDEQERGDSDRDREDEVRRAHRGRDEDGERRLRRVGDRRDRVRGEDRKREELREQPVLELARCEGPPDQGSLGARRQAPEGPARPACARGSDGSASGIGLQVRRRRDDHHAARRLREHVPNDLVEERRVQPTARSTSRREDDQVGGQPLGFAR